MEAFWTLCSINACISGLGSARTVSNLYSHALYLRFDICSLCKIPKWAAQAHVNQLWWDSFWSFWCCKEMNGRVADRQGWRKGLCSLRLNTMTRMIIHVTELSDGSEESHWLWRGWQSMATQQVALISHAVQWSCSAATAGTVVLTSSPIAALQRVVPFTFPLLFVCPCDPACAWRGFWPRHNIQ